MRKFSSFLFIIGSLMLMTITGYSQKVYKDKDGLFSTDLLADSVLIGNNSQVVIQSASTLAGTIQILTTTENMVTVEYYKKSKSVNKSRAIDHIDLVAVDLSCSPSGIRLQLRAPNPPPWNTSEATTLDISLYVPAGSFLEIDASYFNLDITGPLTGVVVPSSLGRLKVTDVIGILDLTTANRHLTISNISGKISVETSNSTLEAHNIYSPENQAVFRNQGGDLNIDGFEGQISIKNSFGRIELIDFRPRGDRNIIRGKSAPIVIDIIDMNDEQIIVSNKFEDIDITVPSDLSAALSLSVDDEGKIEVSDLEFIADFVQKNRLSLIAGEGNSNVNCSVNGTGNIYIRGIDMEEK
ncbi:MAG: hypothetical protein DRP47_07770 [Candidatus Zixiibacteriota bacterium]|nr:MAG: hypothetical protein DRP47_07770 [candidate division Zixibacteria bacterium]